VRIVKNILFNEVLRTWSNRYHFAGGTPPDDGHWHTLFDNIVAAEKLVMTANCNIIAAFGYAAGSDVPVSSKTYTQPGLYAGGSFPQASDVAALVRYSTAERTAKNHPVYLFNYYHDAFASSNGSGRDVLLPAQNTLLTTYGSAWISGFSDGTTTYNRAGPRGAAATGVVVEKYLTHRDFPR